MAKIYRAKIVLSFGGRNVKNSFGNGLLFRTELDRGAQGLKDLCTAIANTYKTILTPDTRILRVVLSPVNVPGQPKQGRGQNTTVDFDLVGTRAMGAGEKGVYANAVAIFKKNAAFGTSGLIAVRGAYLQSETDTSSDRRIATIAAFNKASLTAFGTALFGVFQTAACPLILPAPKGENFVTAARPVTALTYQTIDLRDVKIQRKSVSQAEKDLAKREVAEVQRQYDDALANGQSVGNGSDFYGVALDILFDIMLKFGRGAILQFVVPAGLKALITAAAALSGQGGRPQLPS